MPPKLIIAPGQIHQLRYVKHKMLGVSIEEIAKEDGVGEKYVLQSISRVETYRSLNTVDAVKAAQAEVLLFNQDLQKIAVRNGLSAKIKVYDEKTGELVREDEDHETQLKTVTVMKDMAESLIKSEQKVTPPSQQNVNVNVLASGGTAVGVSTFEDRLREVKRKMGERKEQQTLPEPSEVIDVEEVRPDWSGEPVEGTA